MMEQGRRISRSRLFVRASALGATTTIMAVLLTLAGPLHATADDQHFFRIGAGAVDHPAFGVAGLIASGISSPQGGLACEHGGSCGVPGLIAIAQSVPNSTERLQEVVSGELDAALMSSDQLQPMPTTKKAAPPLKELASVRSVATLYAEPIQLIVRADASFLTPNDLKSKSVAISAALDYQQKLLVAWSKPLRFAAAPAYLTSLEDDLKALADGRVDAVLTIGAGPIPAVADTAMATNLRLLPITGAEQPGLSPPCLTPVRIDASAYRGIAETPTLALTTQLVTRQDAAPDLIYAVAKALWNSSTHKLLVGGGIEAQDVRIDNSTLGLVAGLHPGATRYYREAGILRSTAMNDLPLVK